MEYQRIHRYAPCLPTIQENRRELFLATDRCSSFVLSQNRDNLDTDRLRAAPNQRGGVRGFQRHHGETTLAGVRPRLRPEPRRRNIWNEAPKRHQQQGKHNQRTRPLTSDLQVPPTLKRNQSGSKVSMHSPRSGSNTNVMVRLSKGKGPSGVRGIRGRQRVHCEPAGTLQRKPNLRNKPVGDVRRTMVREEGSLGEDPGVRRISSRRFTRILESFPDPRGFSRTHEKEQQRTRRRRPEGAVPKSSKIGVQRGDGETRRPLR